MGFLSVLFRLFAFQSVPSVVKEVSSHQRPLLICMCRLLRPLRPDKILCAASKKNQESPQRVASFSEEELKVKAN